MPVRYILPFLRHRFLDPLKELANDSRSIGIALLLATVISLALANSPIANAYIHFWETPVHLPYFQLPHSLLHWINDGLMALFFMMAGMEIKSELNGGELSNPKAAALPIGAAVGGMLVPALIYAAFNFNHPGTAPGWGVPMATDIAFAIGVSSLLGKRVPFALKVFLTALATIDDLGAIIVIAAFYGGKLQMIYLSGAVLMSIFVHFYSKRLYKPNWLLALAGIMLWYYVFNSGIHATVAGVLFGLLMPVRWLHRISIYLHNWVYFGIIPIFALANTAIPLTSFSISQLATPLSAGIGLGLLLGKPVGVVAGSYLLYKLGLGQLPEGVNWRQLTGAGLLAGIGFTMSIFISLLAFGTAEYQQMAKIVVLISAAVSIGLSILWFQLIPHEKPS